MWSTSPLLHRLNAQCATKTSGQIGALDAGLKPLNPANCIGRAGRHLDLAAADNWYVHVALLECCPGDVLVIDAKGFSEAWPWGDVLTAAAQERGIAGLVIDRAVRNSQAITASGLPVFARGRSIKGTNTVVPNVPVR